jgi:hypothetical protein
MKDTKEEIGAPEDREEENKTGRAAREPYRNWFLLLGVISGIAVGLAAGSILVNRDSEKIYTSEQASISTSQANLAKRIAFLEKREKEIGKTNKALNDSLGKFKEETDVRIKGQRSYIDDKRIRIWREIDIINKKLSEIAETLQDVKDDVKAIQSKD